MAITYSEQKSAEWERFKRNGGEIVFEVDREDISTNADFESDPDISKQLDSGFELPPSLIIGTPELQVLIGAYGSQWDYIMTRVYLEKGRVVYKRKLNGKYDAHCVVPAVTTD